MRGVGWGGGVVAAACVLCACFCYRLLDLALCSIGAACGVLGVWCCLAVFVTCTVYYLYVTDSTDTPAADVAIVTDTADVTGAQIWLSESAPTSSPACHAVWTTGRRLTGATAVTSA